MAVADLVQKHGIAEGTYYRWKSKFGGVAVNDAKRLEEENRRLDELALQAMETLDPALLLKTVRENNISMCGVLPAVIVMETLIRRGTLTKHQRTGYATSAETTGDSSRVVGYAGMLLG